mgnify:CR=1 FL=1
MVFGGLSVWQLLIILVIVVLLFGTKKLRNLGGDLGSAVRSFRGAVKEGQEEAEKFEADEPDKQLDDKASAEGQPEASQEREKSS